MLVDAVLAADRERAFADWGEAVTLREVAQFYDPETGQLEESYTDTTVTAIVGPAPADATRGTAGQHRSEEVTFLVRPEELPSGASLETGRIVRGGTEYVIVSSAVSAQGTILAVHGRRV